MVFCAWLGWSPAYAVCAGAPYDQFDFWVGIWHDPATQAGEHYSVRRTAGGCAIEEVLTGGDGQIQGIGLAGWDSERSQWRQLWADSDKIVTVYRSSGRQNVRPHVRAEGWGKAMAVHVSEHPAEQHGRRLRHT